MNNIGITEGMGKKIVEALKKQTDLGSTPIQEETSAITMNMDDSVPEIEYVEPVVTNEEPVIQNGYYEAPESQFQNYAQPEPQYMPNANSFNKIPVQPEIQPQQAYISPMTTNFSSGLKLGASDTDFDMPTNVAVLKQLITQLPTGVTKQTGAQIIKQTMEALGISMKSVLQEAQQVQESLNNSTRECQSNILEYKKQISMLEKQSQQYQRQYAVLNDIISLFIQTNNC